MGTPFPQEWLERLKLGSRVGRGLITDAEQTKQHPYGEALRKALDIGVSAVFCLNDHPCAAAVLTPPDCNSEWLQELYTILWNQGELDYLLLLFPDRVDIYTLDANPQSLVSSSSQSFSPTLLDVISEAGEIEAIITGLESGRLLENKKGGLKTEGRVDASLIGDLEGVRRDILTAEGFDKTTPTPKDSIEQVHDVLLQAMFLLYLEDRGIIEAGYIHQHGNGLVVKLHDLLRLHPNDFIRLLGRLDQDLNGGLFKCNQLWKKHAQILADFLQGMRNFQDGQWRLFRLYRFEHIPVELLSEVYDRFLGSEGGKKEQGAYYTPRRLAALVVDQAWDALRQCLDAGELPKVLDPSCGSGIFPALIFQRIAEHLPDPSWEDLKQVAEHLHGIDINPTAIRITAFSLYVALLHRAEPKELQKLMLKGKVLPELINRTLIQGDFFDHPVEARYTCIIGNPPWGREKQKGQSTGELWTHENKYPKPTQRERSWPFIWKNLAHLTADGTLALLLPSTGFFLNDTKECLTRLLDVAHLWRLLDLSDLRHLLFKKADFPACILSATRVKKRSSYRFDYLCPKADLNATRGDRILLSAEDKHLIDAQAFAADSVSTTQRLMWFGSIERRLLSYLDTLPALCDLPLLETNAAREKYHGEGRPDWGLGLGFQAYKKEGKPLPLPELATLPYIETQQHTPWVQCDISSFEPFGKGPVAVLWTNYHEGFTAPHIVAPRSIRSGFRLQVTYSEQSYSFMTSLMGITVPDSDEGRATGKLLTAFLNSTFTAWFMASLGLAVNRPRFTPSTILPLPFPQPKDLLDPERAKAIRTTVVARMDKLLKQAQNRQLAILTSEDAFPSEQDIRELDDLIFAYLGLRPEEIAAIQENLELVRKAAQPARNGGMPELWKASQEEHWNTYCGVLGKTLSTYMDEGDLAWAEAIGYSQDVVVVRVTYQQGQGKVATPPAQKPRVPLLQSLPKSLLKKLDRPLGGNVYLQRCVTVFDKQYILLVKPRQRRFWLSSAAHMDADHIVSNLLQAAGSLPGERHDH